MRFPTQITRLLPLLLLPCLLTAQTYGNDRLQARESAALGLLDKAAIDQMMVFIPGIGSPSRENLVRQNIKSYMMPIRQVTPPSQEWAYALASCVEYYTNLNNNFKDNLSPDYLTLSLANQGNRPELKDGLDLIVREGTVTAAIVPYGSQTIPNAVFSVPRSKISNYGYLFRPDVRARSKVFEVRNALSRGNPVLVELRTGNDFLTLRGSLYAPGAALTDTHYLTVVGYDSDEETFELRGTFGRLWAGAGYVRISFDDFGRMAQSGFVLIP